MSTVCVFYNISGRTIFDNSNKSCSTWCWNLVYHHDYKRIASRLKFPRFFSKYKCQLFLEKHIYDAPKLKLAAILGLLFCCPVWVFCGIFSLFFCSDGSFDVDLTSVFGFITVWYESLKPSVDVWCLSVPLAPSLTTVSVTVLSLTFSESDSFRLVGVFCCIVTLVN